MGFVVRATGRDFGVSWIASGASGSITFGARQSATIFPTLAEAEAAAHNAAKSYGALGITFTVEAEDWID
jgi:hypothetical protein